MHVLERPSTHKNAGRLAPRPHARIAQLTRNPLCQRNRQLKDTVGPAPVTTSSAESCEDGAPRLFRTAIRKALVFASSISVVLSPGPEPDWRWPMSVATAQAAEAYSVAAYERAVAGRRDGSGDGPNLALFTEDAQQAMARLRQYGQYLESMSAAEAACGTPCVENREVLEQAWQVVANEHYSASGAFSETGWADTLLEVLKSHGGLLPTKSDLEAAISDMLTQLKDPYTEYLPPAAFRRAIRRPLPREQSYLRAQYVGLGLELGPVAPGGGRTVLAPLAGSPAESVGIVRGDRLMSIDGTPVDQLGVEQLRGLMRGPAGSTATLEWIPAPTASTAAAATTAAGTAQRLPAPSPLLPLSAPPLAPGGPRRIVMDVERRDLPQPAIKVSKVPVGPPGFYITYVRLLYFGSETSEGLEAALRRHEASPANVGYVLDLRNNPGGVFEEAIASASLFLRRGDVITKTIRGPGELVDTVWQVGSLPEEVFPAQTSRLAAKPVVLLANRSTASASEVFAGTLRDNRRATLLGERTFGKGLVQYYFPLRGGKDGDVRVTVAKYLTPSGYDISGRGSGLAPDRSCTDYPREGLPTSLQQSDQCIRQAAALLADKT